jgi:uncharacterized membrane protein YkvA (DUF1232 family)
MMLTPSTPLRVSGILIISPYKWFKIMFEKIKAVRDRLKDEIQYYRLVYKHPQTPRAAKVFLWMGLGYFFMPFDLIPDFIPIIGHLDDLVIIPLLIYLGIRLVPESVKQECRQQVRDSKQ